MPVDAACPQVNPLTLRKIHVFGLDSGVADRGHQDLGADQELEEFEALCIGIVRIMQEEMADDRPAASGGFHHKQTPIKVPRFVDLGETAKVSKRFRIAVELVIFLGLIAFVCAEDRGKGVEFDPTQHQFFGAVVVSDGVGDGGVSADIAVVEAVARKSARQ